MVRASHFGPLGNYRFWLGCVAMAATVIGTSALTRHGNATEARVLAAACLAAAGTLVSAAVSARAVRYPRWAYWTTAGLMALGLIASAVFASTPQVWAEHTRDTVWLVPWFFMLLGLTPGAKQGICAPSSPMAGGLLIATGVLYSLILQIPSLLHRA